MEFHTKTKICALAGLEQRPHPEEKHKWCASLPKLLSIWKPCTLPARQRTLWKYVSGAASEKLDWHVTFHIQLKKVDQACKESRPELNL